MWFVLTTLYFAFAILFVANAKLMGWIFIPMFLIDLFLLVHSLCKLCK